MSVYIKTLQEVIYYRIHVLPGKLLFRPGESLKALEFCAESYQKQEIKFQIDLETVFSLLTIGNETDCESSL